MDNRIVIRLREVYGQVKAYPASSQAERLAAMVGTKTLTQSTLRHAAAMGFDIRVTAFTGSITGAEIGMPATMGDLARISA